jgi:recombination protein RecT
MSVSALKQATGAVAKTKPTNINQFLEVYKGEIARALPKHMTADRMARIALTECRKTPALLKCKPESLFGAVIQAAQLGLEPGGAMGHAYLIPFGSEVQFIVGYRGMIDLARRSGQIVSLEAHAVYEGDKFECVFGLNSNLTHTPDWDNPNRTKPDALRFVYAVAKLKDGGTQFEVMSRAEIDAIRARSKAGRSGPWVTDYAAMALKTVIRRLFKYLPVSIELAQAVALDEKAEVDISQDNGYVIEGVAEDIDTDTGEIKTPGQATQQDDDFIAAMEAADGAA